MGMDYGKLIIIPDENQVLGGVFETNIRSSHLTGIQEFCDKYKLGYKFRNEEYQDAPCRLALDGHLILKTVEQGSGGVMICYIPPLVTDNQAMWISSQNFSFDKYSYVGAYAIDEEQFDDKQISYKEVEGMDNIIKVINQKNMLYNKQVARRR